MTTSSFNKVLLIALLLLVQPDLMAASYKAAEPLFYSGEISDWGRSPDEGIQVELTVNGSVVTGFYVVDKTGEIVTVEGRHQPLEQLNLKAFSNNTHIADIKLVKHISSAEEVNYTEGSIHWVGYIFPEGGSRRLVHLVQTESEEKHPAITDWGSLPGVAYFLDISYDPETGRQVYDGSEGEKIDGGVESVPCIGKGIPWLDCQLNYHPVDGCFLTETQREVCRKGPFYQSSSYCWNYEKGPGLQLPFQQVAESRIDLSNVEIVKAKAEIAEARTVTASAEQVSSRQNFLDRPICAHAYAAGPFNPGMTPILPPE